MMRDINYFGMREMLKDCICEVQEKAVNSSLPGISTGFKPIDDLTGGLENGKVYVIGKALHGERGVYAVNDNRHRFGE